MALVLVTCNGTEPLEIAEGAAALGSLRIRENQDAAGGDPEEGRNERPGGLMNPKWRKYDLLREPAGRAYRELIEYSLSAGCGRFSLVQRHSSWIHCEEALSHLSQFELGREERSQWPGTVLTGNTALVFSYVLSRESILVLTSLTDRLYGWVGPELPEDLCLYGPEGDPWLVTIAHEKCGWVLGTEGEIEAIRRSVAGIQLATEGR